MSIPNLIIGLSIVAVLAVTVTCVVIWLHREPAGHGVHRTRPALAADTPADELPPLPVQDVTYDDRLQPHIDAAWAAAGTSQGAWWAAHAPEFERLHDFPAGAGPVPAVRERAAVTPPGSGRDGGPSNLPGVASSRSAGAALERRETHAGELSPNQQMNLWAERDSVISDPGLQSAIRSAVDPGWADRDLDNYFSMIRLDDIFAGQGLQYTGSAA